MIGALVAGMLAGLGLALLIGPVFFALINLSISRGFRAGATLALGISAGDALALTIVYLTFQSAGSGLRTDWRLGLVGGIVTALFGLGTLRRKGTPRDEEAPPVPLNDKLKLFGQGAFLNLLNPAVWALWFGIVVSVATKQNFDRTHDLLFFAGTILTVLSTDLGKAYAAKKLRRFITPTLLTWLNRITGTILLLAGLRLIIYAIQGAMAAA